jgi:UDP-glucose:(heptosyl)LPS alpha-1,3-glucosyltransferase
MNSGVKKRIHFLGFVRDLRALYWSADMITLTANSAEIFPKTTLEGMSCGLPAVATDRSGVAEFIEEDVNGFLSTSSPHDIAVKWHKTLRKGFTTKAIHQIMKKKINLGRMTREYREALGVN